MDPARTEAARRQLRAPIPAEAAGALAQERVRRPVAIDRALAHLARTGEHGRDWPLQIHADRVADGADDAPDIEPPRPELVLDVAEAASVQPDRTARVDRLEDKVDVFVAARAFLEVHGAMPAPGRVADPLLRDLAIAAIRIRDRPRSEQGIMHAAWHRGGEPLAHEACWHRGCIGVVRRPIRAGLHQRARMSRIWPAQPWHTVKRANGPTCASDRLDHGARTLARAMATPRPGAHGCAQGLRATRNPMSELETVGW